MVDWADVTLTRTDDEGATSGHDVVIDITRDPGASTGTLDLYLDGSGTAALTTTVDWPTAGSYLGFTAGAGGYTQTSTVDDLTVTWHN